MIYERLRLMRDLLADDGSIYVHCDWRVNSLIRLALDEVFGRKNFRNEIIWHYSTPGRPADRFPHKHDMLITYGKTNSTFFDSKGARVPYSKEYIESHFTDKDEMGRVCRKRFDAGKWRFYYPKDGMLPNDIWDIPYENSQSLDRTGYPTQKPEVLLERIIKASSNESDLIADFFVGSGTTAAVAEKLGRKWIASDLGKFSIHTTRKRMIGVQRQLKKEDKDYRAFEVLNLGKYERQHYIGINVNLREEEKRQQLRAKEAEFLELILNAYKSEGVQGFTTFHGKKAGRMVVIGPVNLPVTRLFVEEVILEARNKHISKVDILGFEFEMGLFPNVLDEARKRGIDIAPKYIPAEVFDKRAVEHNQVAFHDVAYIEAKVHREQDQIAVELTDFSVFYAQGSINQVEQVLSDKKLGSKVIVEKGQVIKISKDKDGIVNRDTLTKDWTDWIDYWSVDFDFESKREIIRIKDPATDQWKEEWTGEYIFENEWQSFRTKKDRSLEHKSVFIPITGGQRKIAVKVVDIFGNDTMTLLEVRV